MGMIGQKKGGNVPGSVGYGMRSRDNYPVWDPRGRVARAGVAWLLLRRAGWKCGPFQKIWRPMLLSHASWSWVRFLKLYSVISRNGLCM